MYPKPKGCVRSKSTSKIAPPSRCLPLLGPASTYGLRSLVSVESSSFLINFSLTIFELTAQEDALPIVRWAFSMMR